MAEWNSFRPPLALWQCLPCHPQKSWRSCVWTCCQSASLQPAPTPLKTSRDWCTMRVEPFPFSRGSLAHFSFSGAKNPYSNHQTDVTVFSQGCVPALMTDQVRQGRDASTFALGTRSAFTILWGCREAPALPQCIRASPFPLTRVPVLPESC